MADTHPFEPDVRIPDGANDDGDGIVVGDGPIDVDAYIDFLSPFCRQFEERSGPIPWVAYVTERALVRGVSGTPSTFVEGVPVPANAQTILAAIGAVATAGAAH